MKLRIKKQNKSRVFLDYASITPIDEEIQKEMNLISKKIWANPLSLHKEGEDSKNLLEESRIKIARIMHCKSSEIIFTSGGTEGLNIGILGVVESAKQKFVLPHIITSSIEHSAVLEPIKKMVKMGKVEATFILPDKNGIIKPESIKKELKENTVLVAIHHANNEIGVIQPIKEISKLIKDFRESKVNNCELSKEKSFYNSNSLPVFLVDASQSVLYENVSLERLGADILVLDGIKIYGPRGFGVMVLKHGTKISPIIFGGGQENGLRSGTSNVIGAFGFAKALEKAEKLKGKESKRLKILRDYFVQKILEEIPKTSLNGDKKNRLPNNVNICFSGQDSEFLVIKLDILGFSVSAASACSVLSLENSSYVIESLGDKSCGSSSIRFTFGRDTKKSDLDKLVSILKKIIK